MYFPANGGGDGRDVTYQRLPECSLCPPGKCGNWTAWMEDPVKNHDLWHELKPRPPAWCCTEKGNDGPCSGDGRGFDPEGFVSTLTCVVASVLGLHFGHILVRFSSHAARMRQCALIAALCWLLPGIILHYADLVRWNTDLYSVSFLLFTSGVSGLLFCAVYMLVDYVGFLSAGSRMLVTRALFGFKAMGMNAITVYILAEGGIPDWFLSCFYLDKEEQNLQNILWPTGVYWGQDDDDWATRGKPTHKVEILLWIFAYIGVWMALACYLHHRGIFIKV